MKISGLGPLGSLGNLESLAVYASTIPKFPKFLKFPTTKKPYPTPKIQKIAKTTPLCENFAKTQPEILKKIGKKILVRKNIPQNPSEYFCKKPNTGFVFIKTNLIFAGTITN